MKRSTPTPFRGPGLKAWRAVVAAATLLGLLFAAADWGVGRWQQGLIRARKDHRARLDRLAFYALRTGIDDINHQQDGRYRVRFIIQNAGDEPIYVMMPTVEGEIQVGPRWVGIQAAEPPESQMEASVVRLVGDRATDRFLTINRTDYTESIPGYIHLKLTLDAVVSPEQDPRDDVGEHREDLVVYLKDYRWANDRLRYPGHPTFSEKPDFIPLRAWTLVPHASRR